MFDYRLFISKFFVKAVCISLVSFPLSHFNKSSPTLLQVLQSLNEHVLNVWYTTNGLSVNNNNNIYVVQTSRNRMNNSCDLCCCLLPQCLALHTCFSGFPIEKSGAVTTMWRWCQVQRSQKECAIGAVHCKMEGCWCNLQMALLWMCDSLWTGCARRTLHKYIWRQQAITEWSRSVISIVACCHSMKLCAHAAWASRSQHKKYTWLSFACPIHGNN